MAARTTLTDAWPLFGLRLRTERLELRMPTEAELPPLLEVGRAGIHPPDEMPFGVAWSTLPSPAFERGFLQHYWKIRGEWTPDQWFLNFLVQWDGRPIGAQSLGAEAFAIHHTVATGSWLGLEFQRRGFGTEMRAAVLGLAFDGLGALVAESSAFLDNVASTGVSRALGYEPNGFGSLAPEGVARPTQRFRMTLDGWRARPRPPLEIEGLDACRDLFGLAPDQDPGSRAEPD